MVEKKVSFGGFTRLGEGNQLPNPALFVAKTRENVLLTLDLCGNCNESEAIIYSMGVTVGGMTDAKLLQHIAELGDFTKNDPFSDMAFGSGSILKGLKEYAWRRELIPERPDWSVELNRSLNNIG